jgi:hypothetical protein
MSHACLQTLTVFMTRTSMVHGCGLAEGPRLATATGLGPAWLGTDRDRNAEIGKAMRYTVECG